MKAFTGFFLFVLVSAAAGEDPDERKRVRAEQMATLSSQMGRHLRKEGDGHSQKPRAMRQAHEDLRSRKAREPSAKVDEHAKKIRRVADQLSEQHRKHMEQPMPHGLHKVREARYSLADMKTNEDSRAPSAPKASAAKNAKQMESLNKLAKHMSHHFDAAAARDAVAKGDHRTIKAAHDAQGLGRMSGHGAAPVRGKMHAANLKDMQHKLAQPAPQKLDRKDTEGGENSNPAEEGEE